MKLWLKKKKKIKCGLYCQGRMADCAEVSLWYPFFVERAEDGRKWNDLFNGYI